MKLYVDFEELTLNKFRSLSNLFVGSGVEFHVYCNNLPAKLCFKDNEIISVKHCEFWENDLLINYLTFKDGLDMEKLKEYIEHNLNTETVRKLLVESGQIIEDVPEEE